MRASKDLYAYCIVLNNMLSFMVNLFLTEGKCSVLYMHLQYVSCSCKLLISCVSVSNTLIRCMPESLGYWTQILGLQIMCIQIPPLWAYSYAQLG